MTIGINTKGTLAYFKHEVTAGLYVVPSSATDGYFEVSDGAAITASKEVLESDLISLYLGRAKGQHGMQDAGGSCAVEWKHSGTEGIEGNFAALIETALGAKSVAVAELVAIAGSTTTVINVADETSLEVGEFLLIKDATNGYSIRPIKSLATGAITVEPALLFAPPATTALGKCVLYKGANDSHKHGTFGLYHGNVNRERVGGCLVESLSIKIETGQIIKAEFALKGLNADYISASAAPHTPTFMNSDALVGLDVECWVGGTKVDFKSGTLTVKNEIKEVLTAKEQSGKVLSKVGSRDTEMAIMLYSDNASHANQTAYDALTDFSFVLVCGKKDSNGKYVAGKCFGIYLPNCYFGELPRAAEDNILVENAVVRSHRSVGLNEIFLGFI